MNRLGLRADRAAAGHHVHERVVVRGPRNLRACARFERRMDERDGSVCCTWANVPVEVASDKTKECAPVISREQDDPISSKILVARWQHLVPRWQIHPQLN